MVKQITAWAAEDGKVFSTESEAAEHDVRVKLKALNIFNEGSINAIMANAASLRRILATLPPETISAQYD